MGEVIIQRDARERIIGLTMQVGGMSTPAKASAINLLRAVVESLSDYLHVTVEYSFSDEMYLEIDRNDQHLDREIDAILATMGSGLRLIEREYPDELIIHDAKVSVGVQA